MRPGIGRAVAGLGSCGAELDARPSTPPPWHGSGRRSPAATSTRSTSSATPPPRTPGDPLPALRRITALPGARYGGLLAGDGWAIGLRLARRRWSGARTAGARRGRSRAPARPPRPAGSELLASAKERAEHVMIVDLERNDLAHVARTGTVDGAASCSRYAGGATCGRPSRGWWPGWPTGWTWPALLRAVCPGGSVTGAPKLAALAQIAALEPVGRGPSMGALGWLDRGPPRPRADHPHRRRRRRPGAPVGRRRHHLGLRPRTPKSPRPPPRPPRSAPPSPPAVELRPCKERVALLTGFRWNRPVFRRQEKSAESTTWLMSNDVGEEKRGAPWWRRRSAAGSSESELMPEPDGDHLDRLGRVAARARSGW